MKIYFLKNTWLRDYCGTFTDCIICLQQTVACSASRWSTSKKWTGKREWAYCLLWWAKSDGDEKEVLTVRDYIDNITGFQNLTVIKKEQNLGLAESIITGVTELCERYGRVIVVEDDLVASPHFLAYVNEALARYADDDRVMQISGYMFPVELHAATDAVFLPFTTCWGWGHGRGLGGVSILIWPAMKKSKPIASSNTSLIWKAPIATLICSKRRWGGIDSWAIRWYLSVFLLGVLRSILRSHLSRTSGSILRARTAKDAGMTDIIDPDLP